MRGPVLIAAMVAWTGCQSASPAGDDGSASHPQTFEVGPNGGVLTTPDGFALSIPPGALAAQTTIAISTVDPPVLPGSFPAVGHFHAIDPAELVFAIPATATMSRPADVDTPVLGVFATSDGFTLEDLDADDPDRTVRVAGAVHAPVPRAGKVGLSTVAGSLGAATADYLRNGDAKCGSALASPLASQLVRMRQVQTPLVPMSPIVADVGYFGVPEFLRLLQADAAASLVEVATTARSAGSRLTITAAYRTAANQYVLAANTNCSNGTARPFHSNHSSGKAVDVNGLTNDETQPAIGWFEDTGAWCWRDHQTDHCKNIGDKVHFEHFASPDETSAARRAFVDLWNCNEPAERLVDTGVNDAELEAALARAPVAGFAVVPDAVAPPDACPAAFSRTRDFEMLVGDTAPFDEKVLSASGRDLQRRPRVTSSDPTVATCDGTNVHALKVGTTVLHVVDPLSDLTIDLPVVVGANYCGMEVCTSAQTCEYASDVGNFCCGPCDPDEACSACDCIASTEQCCTETGDAPMVLPAGEPCCPAHFQCHGSHMMMADIASRFDGHCCYMVDDVTEFCPPGYSVIGFHGGSVWVEDQDCTQRHDVYLCYIASDPTADCWQGPGSAR